ncbi:MAG: BMP family ABC transporter substrate-binding protein [Haloarculaceae archaeon]
MTDEGSRRRVSRRTTIKALGGLGTAGLAGLAGCSGSGDGGGGSDGVDGGDGDSGGGSTPTEGMDGTPTSSGMDSVSAAWVLITEPGDMGWSWAHDQGRKAVDEQYDWLETSVVSAVAPPDAERTVRELTNAGNDIVFTTSFEYQDPTFNVAENNPETVYEHCSGFRTRENMGRYFGRMAQARYLAGVAAGMATEADSLGYVAAFPISEVVRGINAFTLGARSVNSAVTTKVRWTNSWFDPQTEREAANALVDEGVDVMAQHQDSSAAVQAAAEADIWATGYDAPMGEFAGENYLTSPIWHWEVFYEPTVRAVREGTWESDFYYEGLDAGIVDIDDWGPEVPDDVKSEVEGVRGEIESGSLDIWADSTFADASTEDLFQNTGSYVEGVEGSVPSGN